MDPPDMNPTHRAVASQGLLLGQHNQLLWVIIIRSLSAHIKQIGNKVDGVSISHSLHLEPSIA